MNVPCRASERRRRASGSAAVRIACHATPRTTIEPHIRPRPSSTQVGVARSRLSPIWSSPMRSQREQGQERGGEPGEADPGLAGGRAAAIAALALGGLEAGQAPLGGQARPEIGRDWRRGTRRRARGRSTPAAWRRRRCRPRGPRRRPSARRSAARARAPRRPSPRAALGRHGEVAQGLGQGGGVAAREEHAVDPVAHDVAVAGDVGGDDRRAGGEGLGEHHAEALAAQRGRDEQVGRGQRGGLLGVGDLAQHVDALRAVEHERLDLVAIGAHDDELDGDVVAQRLEGAQQDGKPLALDRLADEGQAQRRARRPRRGASEARRARRPRWG